MKGRTWTRIAGAVIVMLVAGVALGQLATFHKRQKTGRHDVEGVSCANCHAWGREVEYRQGPGHSDPTFLAMAGRDEVYVSGGSLGRIARADLDSGEVLESGELGGLPRGVAASPDGQRLVVALTDADVVALLDPVSLALETTIAVGAEPAGLAFSADPPRLFVANSGSGDVSVIDVEAGEEIRRIRAGREPWAVAASADGSRIAVVSRMAELTPADEIPRSEITLIDPTSMQVRRRIYLDSCHMSEAATFTPDGRFLLVPALRTRNLLPIAQVARGWVMSSVLAVVEVESGRVSRMPLADPSQGFPDPTGVAVDPEQRRVWVAAGGSNEVAWLDLDRLLQAAREHDPEAPERLSTSREYVLGRMPVGRNPQGLAVSAAGLVVAERLDDTVGVYSATGPVRQLPIGRRVAELDIRRGDAVFHDARYAFQQSFSCRSCHPGGHTDGLTYDFDIDGVGRDVVLNRSLLGVKDTAPFKWIGLNPTLNRQCGVRFAMVLTRADPFPEPQLEDLVSYLESLPPPRPVSEAGRVAGLDSGAVQRGRGFFERAERLDGQPIPVEQRCTTCHSGPHFSNGLRENVGTRGPLDSTGDFDVPHLTGIASKAPYLHDGRALSLEEIWTLPGVGDQHGVVTDLNKAQLNDLIEYLRTL